MADGGDSPFSVGLFILAFLAFSLRESLVQFRASGHHAVPAHVLERRDLVDAGGFLLASALTKKGLDQKLFLFTLRIAGTTPRRILLGLMVTTMFGSMLMSNTATTAMVVAATTPLLKRLGKEAGLTRALLVGIPLAASVGGMGTIIDSPPNVIAVGALENADPTTCPRYWTPGWSSRVAPRLQDGSLPS